MKCNIHYWSWFINNPSLLLWNLYLNMKTLFISYQLLGYILTSSTLFLWGSKLSLPILLQDTDFKSLIRLMAYLVVNFRVVGVLEGMKGVGTLGGVDL
jgi:hypothetical protein